MKFTRTAVDPSTYWTGIHPLPSELNVFSYDMPSAEWELLVLLARLHGHMTPYDLLTGAGEDTEKDKDITSVLNAYHSYHPRIPLTGYTVADIRTIPRIVTIRPVE